jgi:hypothetical protein
MHLAEHQVIDRHDRRLVSIDVAAYASKNRYNPTLYEVRQALIFESRT